MQISSRRKTTIFAVIIGASCVGLALALNITWVIHWREVGMIIVGLIFFGVIITGLTLNTIFLVREVRRNEQHDSFINAVTHELKTPIASIRLYLETLQSRKLDDAQRTKFYDTMLQDTDRLLATVEQVLRAGQITHKKTSDTAIAVNFSEIVRECVELARTRHHLDESAMVFRDLAVGAEETRVYGDPDELRTAVMNLLENAVKYSPGKVEVVAEVGAVGGEVVLRVSDRGVGISRSELKRIFRRFYRAPQRFASRVKGTGLGLFIVRSIAQRHGGSAEAHSEGEGKGATITLRLPRMHR